MDTGKRGDGEALEGLGPEELLARLHTTREGLSPDEARQRLERDGPNALEEERRHPLLRFLGYFWGPIPWMIEAAALLATVTREWLDLAIISSLLLVNGFIRFHEEHKAETAINLLRQRLAPQARVRRAGRWRTVDAQELVRGDILHLEGGRIVPADARLLEGELELDQAALTGESLPAPRKTGEPAWSGSIVQRGAADAVVTATGMRTYFGRTAALVEKARPTSHYQQAVLKLGRFLILVTLALAAIILVTAAVRHTPMLETLQFVLILTVASIPVALPAVLSVTLAVGAMRLARAEAIVTRLVSIEEMAGVDVLCTDKTGTLTQNRLVPGEPITFGVSPEELLRMAALASRSAGEAPIDKAILSHLEGGAAALEGYTVEHFEPFDAVRKRSDATVRSGARRFQVGKGAPQVILAQTAGNEPPERLEEARHAVEALAGRGMRTLGVARTDEEGRWRLLGLLPLYDAPREDSASTLEKARKLGIEVKMVTGDNLAIAREVAQLVHLGPAQYRATDVFAEGREVDASLLERADGFAEVFPEHKYRIVEVLQQHGHLVGMTGDGVNDAPALKRADVGIAVSGATDAARSAADLVLMAPGLSVIIDALLESRRIFERMTSYATYRLAETVRVLLFMALAILLFDFYPVTAIMLILLALLNDLPIMTIAYDRAEASPHPVRWKVSQTLTVATMLGTAGLVASFLLFWFALRVLKLEPDTLRTLLFLKLAVAGHMTIYLARTGPDPFWRRPYPAPVLLLAAEGTQAVATFVAVYGIFMAPLGWKLAGLVWGYSLLWFFFNDWLKRVTLRVLARRRQRQGLTAPEAPRWRARWRSLRAGGR